MPLLCDYWAVATPTRGGVTEAGRAADVEELRRTSDAAVT